MTSTEYTAVPANIVSPTDTEGYQPAHSYPLQPVGQTAPQSAPPAYDRKLPDYQVSERSQYSYVFMLYTWLAR